MDRAMIRFLQIASIFLIIFFYISVFAADRLVISEVFYDAEGGDDGLEWVELYNGYSTPIDLCQFALVWGGADYTYGGIYLQGTLNPGEYFLIGGPTSNSTNYNPSLDQAEDLYPDVQNSGTTADGIALFDISLEELEQNIDSIPIDAVIYGEENTNSLLDENGENVIDVGDALSGQSISLSDDGTWQIQSSPSPGTGSLIKSGGPAPIGSCIEPPPPPDPEIQTTALSSIQYLSRWDFSDQTAGYPDDSESLVEGLLSLPGMTIGEHLVGQSISSQAPDTISGTPSLPVSAEPGLEDLNLAILLKGPTEPLEKILFGVTYPGPPSGIGEGAIAIVFDADQKNIGFETWESSEGNLIYSFYSRDGSLLDKLTIPLITDVLEPIDSIAFESIDGIPEIAALTIEWDQAGQGPGLRAIWLDICPSDPNKTEPGVCGCGVADTDSDQDGTPDCNDLCPDDPEKIESGLCGCGVADTDSDQDGTPDCNDFCLDDPEKIDSGLCGCGVADTDSDQDGTPDCNDLCPYDPEKTESGFCGCGQQELDSEPDGMIDCWEEENGLDTEFNDSDWDADGDGFNNITEYNRGTDPQDPADHPTRYMPWLILLLEDD